MGGTPYMVTKQGVGTLSSVLRVPMYQGAALFVVCSCASSAIASVTLHMIIFQDNSDSGLIPLAKMGDYSLASLQLVSMELKTKLSSNGDVDVEASMKDIALCDEQKHRQGRNTGYGFELVGMVWYETFRNILSSLCLAIV